MIKKHKLFKELNLNIHNSILTFKEFLKACQNAKPKVPLLNLINET